MDLFECIGTLPAPVRKILNMYNALEIHRGLQYTDLINMGKQLAVYGYSFEFYLDCIPFNLKKIN